MSYAFAFLLILVPLVVIHEFGHFIMAKLGGIRVTKFAFGFGKKLFGFHFKGTEYRWNLLPLGGYVDFMGEAVYTNKIPDDVRHFYNRPKWLRFLVLVMGPMFNLILALAIFWAFHGMKPYLQAVYHGDPFTVGYVVPDSAAAQAGLLAGDRIAEMDGKAVTSIDQVREHILLSPKQSLQLTVIRQGQSLPLSYDIPADKVEGLGVLEFAPARRILVSQVVDDMPAAEAGFNDGDFITAINGEQVYYMGPGVQGGFSQKIQEAEGQAMDVTVEREGRSLDLSLAPVRRETDEGSVWQIGVSYTGEYKEVDLNWRESFVAGWDEFTKNSTMIYRAVRKLVTGELPVKTMSGPVGVGKAAKEYLDYGLWTFLFLMAILSLNLGILNLLPIPVLDGGEIFVLLVEWVTRRDFSIETKMKVKMVGLLFLIVLMATILVTDLIKIFQG